MRDIKMPVTNNIDEPEVDDDMFQIQLQFFARLLCTRAEIYKTCKSGKCRRFKICMGRDREDAPDRFGYKNMPQCVQHSKENHDAMRLQLPKIVAEVDTLTPVDGTTYLSFRPPKPQRNRQ